MAEKSQTKAAAAMADDKKRAIETAMQQIERTYGKGSIMRFGDNTVSNVEAISTGSLALDLALGIGGLPKGRIIEIYGPESSGKTTLALHVLAQAQKAGGEVAFIDAEHALDITYARALGVKVEDMLVSQPDIYALSGSLLGVELKDLRSEPVGYMDIFPCSVKTLLLRKKPMLISNSLIVGGIR